MSSFDVTAILKANVSNFTGGIKEAQSVFEGFKSRTNRTFESVASGFGTAGTAMSATFTAPTVAGITSVIKSYASLEQAVGGVRTLFANKMGDASQEVINNANRAFQTAGVSATKYMEQVSSFSATLLQGLAGDTASAAKYGDKAIIDMADNANKMGTSITDIQNAYQGFAKDNFTMLDNLKLGYGGTQEEMARLVNESGVMGASFKATANNVKDIPFHKLIDAIHETQKRLGITGATAEEAASTVSGSFEAMKAAGQNLVGGLGNNEANIRELMSNMGLTIRNFASNIKRVLLNIWNNLPMAEWQKWIALITVSAGPVLLAISGIMKTVGAMKSVFAGLSVLSNPFALIIVSLGALVLAFKYAYNHSETFRKIVDATVNTVSTLFGKLKSAVQPVIDVIGNLFSKFNIGAFAPLIGAIGLVVVAFTKLKNMKIKPPEIKPPNIANVFKPLTDFVKGIGNSIKSVLTGIGQAISTAFQGIGTGLATMFRGIALVNPATMLAFAAAVLAVGAAITLILTQSDGLTALFNGIGTVITSVGTAIATVISSISTLAPVITAFGTAMATVISSISTGIATVITAVTPIIQILADAFVKVAPIIASAIVQIIQALAPFMPSITQLATVVASVISQIVGAFNTLVGQIVPILEQVKGIVLAFGDVLSKVFSGASDVIKSFGDAVSSILDSLAGVFDSIGNAALNAGQGFKALAEGVVMITNTGLADLTASLAATATGLGAIALQGPGLATAGQAMSMLGAGMMLFGQASVMLQATLTALPTLLTAFTTALTNLPNILTTTVTAMTTFGTNIQTALTGLTGLGSIVTQFNAMLMTIAPATMLAGVGLASFNAQASSANSALVSLGASANTAQGSIVALGAGIQSAMANATASIANAGSQMATTVQYAGTQMTVIMQAAMNQIKSAIINGMNASSQVVRTEMTQMVEIFRTAGQNMVTEWDNVGRKLVEKSNETVNNIRNALNNISNINLYNHGLAVMQSFAQGLDAEWRNIQSSVSSMAQWIRDHKGPISYDRRLLIDNGIALMQGLHRGIDTGFVKVQNLVSSMANAISTTLNSAIDTEMRLAGLEARTTSGISVAHTPQSVNHSINNTASNRDLINKIDELITETKNGKFVYLDGQKVGNTVDRRLGQNTQIRSRTSWH